MKLSAIVMAAATAAMFAFGTTYAYSQSGPPIQVEAFRYVPTDSGAGNDDYDNLVDNGVWLTFKNVGSRTVKDKHKHGAPAKATLISATYADGTTWTSP
jgi:hypothetical protein